MTTTSNGSGVTALGGTSPPVQAVREALAVLGIEVPE